MIRRRNVICTSPLNGGGTVMYWDAVPRVFRTRNGWGLIPSNQSRLFVFESFPAAIYAASQIRNGEGIPPWKLKGVHFTSEMNDDMKKRYGL